MGFNFALLDDHVQWHVFTTYPVNGEGINQWEYGDYGPPVSEEWIRLSLTLFSMLVMISSALSHGMVVVPGGRMLYSWYIQRNQNPRRWFEYTFSFGLVKVVIGLVVGISDIHILSAIFVLNATSMLLLSAHEKVNAKARNDGFYLLWFPYICSIIPQLANWCITASYFGASLVRLDSISIYIWEIFILMFVFDLVLYLVLFYQWAKVGDFDYYVFGEVALIVQAIMAKSFLAWITFGSGLR
uniref:Uncharacterized protein n=1 Tax=Grammatophora oceanica TaxID=210454 RepID=A0A7S1VK12_9STRA